MSSTVPGYSRSELVITPAELVALPTNTTIPIDVTWFMPNSPRNPDAEYIAKRIPNARRMDLDVVASDHPLHLKHMMPTGKVFAEACEKIGVSPSSHVVLYDSHGVFSSPRALFMFKAFGHRNASILNGGLPRWTDEGYSIESGPPKQSEPASVPTPRLQENLIRSYEQIVKATTDPLSQTVVLDARPYSRWTGQDPEPRPNLPSGHMPKSRSLPFSTLVAQNKAINGDGSFTTLLSPALLQQVIDEAAGPGGLEGLKRKEIVASCGSGMTACIIWLALQELGVRSALYDESWTGYAARPESRILKGEE